MRFQKQNKTLGGQQFTPFTQLLNKVDVSSLDEHELRMLKQEHGYLEKLKQQRVKIEEMKRKYEETDYALAETKEENAKLVHALQEKDYVIIEFEEKLEDTLNSRESLEKSMRKSIEQERLKFKNRIKELEKENQEFKKALKQKEVVLLSIEEDFNAKIVRIKEAHQADRKNLAHDYEQKLREARNVNNGNCNEVSELQALVSRQNNALKLQNERCQELESKTESLSDEICWLEEELSRKNQQAEDYENRLQEMSDEVDRIQTRAQEADSNNRMKSQLEEIRRKMTEMTKGEIEKIEFIVNEIE